MLAYTYNLRPQEAKVVGYQPELYNETLTQKEWKEKEILKIIGGSA